MASLLDHAAASAREHAVYLSYDRDAAIARGDKSAAGLLNERWHGAIALADGLETLNPRAVSATPHELSEVRELMHQLAWRISRLEGRAASFVTVPARNGVRRRKSPKVSPTLEFIREDGAEHATPVDYEARCAHCHQPIPVRAEGRPRRYCDARCRNAAARTRRHAHDVDVRVPRAG